MALRFACIAYIFFVVFSLSSERGQKFKNVESQMDLNYFIEGHTFFFLRLAIFEIQFCQINRKMHSVTIIPMYADLEDGSPLTFKSDIKLKYWII